MTNLSFVMENGKARWFHHAEGSNELVEVTRAGEYNSTTFAPQRVCLPIYPVDNSSAREFRKRRKADAHVPCRGLWKRFCDGFMSFILADCY